MTDSSDIVSSALHSLGKLTSVLNKMKMSNRLKSHKRCLSYFIVMIVDSASLVQNLLRREKQTSVSLSHDKTNNLSSFLERTNNMLRVGDKVVYLQAENEPSYGIIKKIHSPNGHWEAEVAFVSTLLNIIKQRCHMLAFDL